LCTGKAASAAAQCAAPALNGLLALGRAAWSALRRQLVDVLNADGPAYRANPRLGERLLTPIAEAELLLPLAIGDYTDFYASVYHATNVGRMMRPDNPLLPSYKHLPIGYHGRASSVVASGTPVRRPNGQTRRDDAALPTFGPSQRLDYELEVACVIGPGNALGEAIPIADAEDHIFGLCLLNDWSARDVQRWEYQPLGPFLAKSFATTVSPWVVTMEALAPFRCPAFARPEGDPPPLPYLASPEDQARGGLDLTLEVYLRSRQMRDRGIQPVRLSRGNFHDMYWTLAQLVTHHASNGCNLRPGDLLASGTVSGAAKESRGCLLELAWGGKEPIELPGGETRRFLEDGDVVTMRGYGERDGCARIGFGECRGEVLKAS
jgi:fumarylacetoacetase